MNPAGMLRADPIERVVLCSVIERAAAYRLDLDRRLARLIVTELGEAIKRGRRRA